MQVVGPVLLVIHPVEDDLMRQQVVVKDNRVSQVEAKQVKVNPGAKSSENKPFCRVSLGRDSAYNK